MSTEQEQSVERAAKITQSLDCAMRHLVAAGVDLREVRDLIELDYPDNGPVIDDLRGALRLIAGQVTLQWTSWHGFTAARERNM